MEPTEKKRRGRPRKETTEAAAMLTEAPRIETKRTCADCYHYEGDYKCRKFDTEVEPETPECVQFQDASVPVKLSDSEQDYRDLANQILGQAQMARAISDFANVITLEKLRVIKETKQYKALSNKPVILANGKTANVSTWEGFCEAIGIGYQKVDEDLRNLNFFGQQALDNLQRIGAGYREMRKLRKLPDNLREEIVQEVEQHANDKNALLQIIDDITARHLEEKNRQREEADANWQAQQSKIERLEREQKGTDKVVSDLTRRNKELHSKLEAQASRKPEEVLQRFSAELDEITRGLNVGDQGVQTLRLWLQAMWKHYDDLDGELPPRQLREQAASNISRVVADLRYLLDEFGLYEDQDAVNDMAGEQWTPGAGGFEMCDQDGADCLEEMGED